MACISVLFRTEGQGFTGRIVARTASEQAVCSEESFTRCVIQFVIADRDLDIRRLRALHINGDVVFIRGFRGRQPVALFRGGIRFPDILEIDIVVVPGGDFHLERTDPLVIRGDQHLAVFDLHRFGRGGRCACCFVPGIISDGA